MKKLLISAALSASALLFGISQAQLTKTYMSENFDTQISETNWDLPNCSTITNRQGQPVYIYQINDGSTVWGGWGYDAEGNLVRGGLPDTLNGTYSMLTHWLPMEENAKNVISFDIWYMGTASNNAAMRKFGVSARQGSAGAWKPQLSVTNMQNGMGAKYSFLLDDEFKGQDSIQLQFSFFNKHDASAYFMFLLDNIQFAAYEDKPFFSASIEDPMFASVAEAANAEIEFDLSIANQGAVDITSVEYAYVTNSGVETQSLNISKNIPAVTGRAQIVAKLKFKDGRFGENKLKIWPVKVNGEAFAATGQDTIGHTVTLVDESKLSADFVPVLESFTSATCSPCATMNRFLNPVLEKLKTAGKINVVKYQMNFPSNGDKYYISTNGTRIKYYDQLFGWGGRYGVPAPIFNAESNMLDWPGSTYTEIMESLEKQTEAAHARKAFMDVTVKKAFVDAATGKLDFELQVTSALDIKEAYVVVLITEKTTTGNRSTNGEKEFHYVNMAAPFGANGKKFEFKTNEPQTITGSVTDMNKTNMEEADDLEIVCFVQAPLTQKGYVYQSVSAEVTAMVANEGSEALRVDMYPNPAGEQVTLRGLNHADVSIYDLTGRRVYGHAGLEETLEIDLEAFSAGTYMVRICQNGKTAHKKLVVRK